MKYEVIGTPQTALINTIRAVVALLTNRGVTATLEHPMFIRVPAPYNPEFLSFGTVNGNWGWDESALDNVIDSGDSDIDGYCLDAQRIADWIEKVYRRKYEDQK